MSAAMIADSVARALAAAGDARRAVEAERAGVDAQAARALAELGLVGSDAGRLDLDEQLAIVEAIGHAGALVGHADTEAMGRWLALAAGFAVADEAIVTAAVGECIDGPHLSIPRRMPWARQAKHVVVAFAAGAQPRVALVPTAAFAPEAGTNLAGEPRDRATRTVPLAGLEARDVPATLGPEAVMARGALLRCAGMAGAARRIQDLTLRYAADRKQFGKSLAQFQVIQSHLAQLAGESVAMAAMLAEAARAAGREGHDASLEIAAAKVRAGQGAQAIAAIAHQVHGAIGFTQEYALQLWTRRLWAWRDEYGNETHWARRLGSALADLGPDLYWERLTA